MLFRGGHGKATSAGGILRGRRPGTNLRSSSTSIQLGADCVAVFTGATPHHAQNCVSESPRHTLSQPGSMEDQALCFFFSTYARPSQSTNHHHPSFYTHLSHMYADSPDDHTLKHIVSAIGLGGLAARRRGDERLLIAADTAYNIALRLTNHALCERETATSDRTLVGVLLLGLYEVDFPLCPPRPAIELTIGTDGCQ